MPIQLGTFRSMNASLYAKNIRGALNTKWLTLHFVALFSGRCSYHVFKSVLELHQTFTTEETQENNIYPYFIRIAGNRYVRRLC